MARLTVESFIAASSDLERAQYSILGAIKEYYADFAHNLLYPGLGELIRLHDSLVELLERKDEMQSQLPQHLTDVDLTEQQLRYESSIPPLPDFDRIVTLTSWTLPLLRKVIEEGSNIYNFVDDRIHIEQVGILPMYRNEGYWFFPDTNKSLMHLLRYELTIFSSSVERFRTLKTKLIESIPQSTIIYPLESIKLWLIERYHDLPNPATYACSTEIDFPFEQTLLPVAKRKFLAYLSM